MMNSDNLGTLSRALTVVQPWAHAIVHLGKDIENRSWKPPETLIGKRFAVHAGGKCRVEALEDLLDEGYSFPAAPVLGAIIGTVRLVGWVSDTGQCSRNLTVEQARVALRSRWYVPGEIGWLLADVHALPSPVVCKGALGLWNLSRVHSHDQPPERRARMPRTPGPQQVRRSSPRAARKCGDRAVEPALLLGAHERAYQHALEARGQLRLFT